MTYEEWTATPMGAAALSLAVHCDTFREAGNALRAAFNAGARENGAKPIPQGHSEVPEK
jgi:hypothetical protein